MSEQPRGPTPAVHRTSPLIEIYGTVNPYINHKLSGLTPYITAFKRAIAPINPFALQQIPTTDSVAVGHKFGERWFALDPYPTRITREHHLYTSHYDPFKNPRYERPVNAQTISPVPEFQVEAFPRHCTRSVEAYKTCLIANDDNKQKCSDESTNILAICPSWALDKMKENNLLKQKVEALTNQKYREAMEVPDYNKGRTIADVPHKHWSDGERSKLRPNSMWADDRYADITQKEVDEAKQRVKRRRLAKGIKTNNEVHYPAYDRTYVVPSTEIPLYP